MATPSARCHGEIPELGLFLSSVDEEMAAIVSGAAALQQIAVPDPGWRGGKRLRPRLVYECCLDLGISPGSAVTLAAVTELIHAASLAHDDVIDDAALRRGRPTLRMLAGNRSAVLFGDLIFSAAWAHAVRELPSSAVGLLATAMTRMAGAEIREHDLRWNAEADWGSCLRVIDGKTAALFAAAASGSATLAGASAPLVTALAACGEGLGRAFQLLDDIQDYTPLRAGWGKQRLKDLEGGIVTLPLVIALRRGRGAAAFHVRRYLAGKGTVPLDAEAVDSLIAETHALPVCLRLAQRICERPFAAAQPFLRVSGLRRMAASLLAGVPDTGAA